jgi:glycosyltransferase involved in cell wall biosynthesis
MNAGPMRNTAPEGELPSHANEKPIRVFVHLAYGFGAKQWEHRWKQGKVIGINEPMPYGYNWAAEYACSVEYSEDKPENVLQKFLRLGVRAVLGFDLVHAKRNFRRIRQADVVWTHTESQYLSILLLFRFISHDLRPKLIAQSVWLFDRWNRFGVLRRRLFANLIRQADILTVHSPENLKLAREFFPQVPSKLVLFGISADQKEKPRRRSGHPTLNLVSIGNDEHRDWGLLVQAVENQESWALKIASSQIDRSLINKATNIEIVRPQSNADLLALYDWADLLVLAIKPNFHASGITVIQEAALRGVPVICSDTGGLNAYFSDSEVRFFSGRDKFLLQQVIRELGADQEGRLLMAERAQARMGPSGLSSQAFVRQHVEISREMLGHPAILT